MNTVIVFKLHTQHKSELCFPIK